MIKTATKIKEKYEAMTSNRSSISERQMFIVYFCSLCTILFVCAINLAYISGPSIQAFRYAIGAVFLINCITALLFFTHKLKLKTAFATLILTSFFETSLEMIALAFYPSEYGMMLLMGNVALLIIIAILPIIAYARGLPYIIGGLSILTYIACVIITKDYAMLNFMLIYIFIFLFTSIFGEMIIHNYLKSERENSNMKRNEKAVLDFFNMDKEEMISFIRLSQAKGLNMQQTEQLLDSIGNDTKERLMNTLQAYLLEKESNIQRLKEAFPELSDSETDICRLIIQGKKLGEMSRLLSKSPSNITCQRTNIRAKLKLEKEDNLKEAIEARLKSFTPEKEIKKA